MSNDWKNTEWQEKLKNKPVRYWIRDEIEEIIKEENINRQRFYEVSKLEYQNILNKFYYSFFEYENKRKRQLTDLSYLWEYVRKELKRSPVIYPQNDYEQYLHNVWHLIPCYNENDKHYLILSQGWVYEGYISEIISVLCETDCLLDDFYIVSNKYEYMIVHNDDGDCMYVITKQ